MPPQCRKSESLQHTPPASSPSGGPLWFLSDQERRHAFAFPLSPSRAPHPVSPTSRLCQEIHPEEPSQLDHRLRNTQPSDRVQHASGPALSSAIYKPHCAVRSGMLCRPTLSLFPHLLEGSRTHASDLVQLSVTGLCPSTQKPPGPILRHHA